MNFLQQALTGADNKTVAIGRLISMAIAVALLKGLPAAAAGSIIVRKVPVADWQALFLALSAYVPAVVGGIVALIRMTASTEPQPKEPPSNG